MIHVGPNDFRLTLTGTQTGAANALSAADNGSGTVLADLGMTAGTPAIRRPSRPDAAHTGAGSLGLDSATQTVAVALGAAGQRRLGTVQINGVGVAINLNTDSLSAIAATSTTPASPASRPRSSPCRTPTATSAAPARSSSRS